MDDRNINVVREELFVGIVRNEYPDSADDWINACKKKGIKYQVIDLSSSDWYEQITESDFDFLLLQPSGSFERFKTMYDERIHIVCNEMKLQTYPSYDECIIYENKKMLSYFLQTRNIPHPQTYIFYNYNEAIQFLNQVNLPIVVKTSIGAAGSGVKIIRDKCRAISYLKRAFKGKGIKRRFGPNRVTGNPKKWLLKAVNSPRYFLNKVSNYLEVNRNSQFGYVIFQEYIDHDFEWRIVKIGDSYFAHKKIKVIDKASGGKVKQFGMPDVKVMNFVDELCSRNKLNFVCVDLFESDKGYLVNEVQCVFGIPYGYLMKVGDDVGRIRKIKCEWTFEPGDFTTNHCNDLRLEYVLSIYNSNR